MSNTAHPVTRQVISAILHKMYRDVQPEEIADGLLIAAALIYQPIQLDDFEAEMQGLTVLWDARFTEKQAVELLAAQNNEMFDMPRTYPEPGISNMLDDFLKWIHDNA